MNINIDLSIRSKWHIGYKRESSLSTIVVHGAGVVDSVENLISWMLDGERKKEYIKGVALFHYAIDRNGEITEIIDPKFWVYHSSCGKQDERTIGIELINGSPNNENTYTKEQYESLFWLIFDKLMEDYPSITAIASHWRMKEKFSGGYKKNCPGNFDWDELEVYMENHGYDYTHDERYESYWGIKKS